MFFFSHRDVCRHITVARSVMLIAWLWYVFVYSLIQRFSHVLGSEDSVDLCAGLLFASTLFGLWSVAVCHFIDGLAKSYFVVIGLIGQPFVCIIFR